MLRGRVLALAITAALAIAVSATVAGAATDGKYTIGINGYDTRALLSVGDTRPQTGGPGTYQMIGIPDGLGAHRGPNGTRIVYMNHELTSATLSQPLVGEVNRGAVVSRLVLDRRGNVLSGDRAYDTVHNMSTVPDNVLAPAQPAPTTTNATSAFSRFCSGDLAGPRRHGFDRFVYITNEEEGNPALTYDKKGGVTVAILDNQLFSLPKLGRFSWENSVTQPANRRQPTVVMSMEDGPADLLKTNENSQVYMYVGTKERGSGVNVLNRNGLDNGKLFVLVRLDASGNVVDASEADFTSGTIRVGWREVPNGDETTEDQLEAASDSVGGIRFARPEDGAFNLDNRNEYFWVTTGESINPAGANRLGRLYSLKIDRRDPTATGTLTVLYNADTVDAAGGDIAFSPDNVGTSEKHLMINEDGTASSRPEMQSRNRDGSIWRFDISKRGLDVSSATRVAELDSPGRDGIPVPTSGTWETSGIISADDVFGRGTWLFDVQAHAPTTAPGTQTVEDGQLLLLVPVDDDDDDDDDDDEGDDD
jgi:Bacterial protein of unknown function (DUF839)